jgi:hypothetical protein
MFDSAILHAVLFRKLPGMFNAAIVPCCTVGELLGIIITVTAALSSTCKGCPYWNTAVLYFDGAGILSCYILRELQEMSYLCWRMGYDGDCVTQRSKGNTN